MSRNLHRISGLLTLLFLVSAMIGCGETEWQALSKAGNLWEYTMTKGGSSTVVTAKVLKNYKTGKTVYAALQISGSGVSAVRVFSWEENNKALIDAGRFSADGIVELFSKERVVGSLKASKGKEYSGWVFQGTEKVKTALGDQDAFIFVKGKTASEQQKIGFNAKFGMVLYQDAGMRMVLKKFTPGKGGDAAVYGSEAGFAAVRNFIKLMAAGGMSGAENFCTVNGKKSMRSADAAVKLVLEKLHKDIRSNGPVTVYHRNGENYGLRFNYYAEENGTPGAYRADLQLTLKGTEKKLIDSFALLKVTRLAPR